jgi:conjugative transfer region protein (TIGR03748 family)
MMNNNPFKLSVLLPLTIMLWVTGCTTVGQVPLADGRSHNTQAVSETGTSVTDADESYSSIQTHTHFSKSTGVQTGRYSAIAAIPTESQRQLLQVMISVTIPDEITTIGETIHYLLRRSGYQLTNPKHQQLELTQLLTNRLPDVQRQLGPMTLEDALTILTTPAFILIEDPVHRLISYQLADHYLGGNR